MIDGSKADIRHLIQGLEPLHHHFAQLFGGNFPLQTVLNRLLNFRGNPLQINSVHLALIKGTHHAIDDFIFIKILPGAVALNHDDGHGLHDLIGGKGTVGDRYEIGIGGYNGGGNGGTAVINDKGQPLKRGDGGCGATHICLEDGVLSKLKTAYEQNRLLMVAGGQGGAQYPTGSGPFGGGTEGGRPTNKAGTTFEAATQTDGFAFGLGQTGRNGTIKTQNGGEGNGGGGGGLYGGFSPQAPGSKTNSPGGGGSGYVNKKLLVNSETIAGNQSFLSPSGVSETGHAGHGAALISWLP